VGAKFIMDYKKEISINQYELDQEWLAQPGKVEEINRLWADAILKRNKAEEKMKVVFAEMDLKIRKNCPEDLVNPKEASYKNYIIASPEYQAAMTEYLECEHEVNVLLAGCKAFSSRGDSLKSLTQLLLSDRYSSPSSPPEKELQAKGVERGTDMVSKRLDKRLNKSIKKPIPKG
jgi:hypothetical protein